MRVVTSLLFLVAAFLNLALNKNETGLMAIGFATILIYMKD